MKRAIFQPPWFYFAVLDPYTWEIPDLNVIALDSPNFKI